MLQAAGNHEFNLIITESVSRFCRNADIPLKSVRELKELCDCFVTKPVVFYSHKVEKSFQEARIMDKVKLNDELLDSVSGGANEYLTQKFDIGNRVMLSVYPEFGIGTVREVHLDGRFRCWMCEVAFDGGIIECDQDELIPA